MIIEVIFDTPAKHKDGNTWSHLAASDLDTLHSFAKKIGLRAQYFQNKPGFPHYDIKSNTIRNNAIKAGAAMVERKVLFNKLKTWYGNTTN